MAGAGTEVVDPHPHAGGGLRRHDLVHDPRREGGQFRIIGPDPGVVPVALAHAEMGRHGPLAGVEGDHQPAEVRLGGLEQATEQPGRPRGGGEVVKAGGGQLPPLPTHQPRECRSRKVRRFDPQRAQRLAQAMRVAPEVAPAVPAGPPERPEIGLGPRRQVDPVGEHRPQAVAEHAMRIDQACDPDPLQPGVGQVQFDASAGRGGNQGVVVRKGRADRSGEAAHRPVEAEETGRSTAIAPDRHPRVGAQLADQAGEVRPQQRVAQFRRARLQAGPGP